MTAPSGGLGSAFIRIRADVSRFAADARRGIQNGVRAAAARLNVSSLVAALRRAGILGGQALGNGVYRDANGRLRDLRGRFVAEGALAGQLYSNAFNRTADFDLKGLGKLSVLMNKFVLGGIAAAKFLPTIIALVGELGQVGVAAAASLPFLITSLLIIKETFSNAFKGIGDAISAAFEQDPGKLQAALEDLTPAARAFVLEIAKAAPVLEAVQKDIQEHFFKPLKGSFEALRTSGIIGDLALVMTRIADDAGAAAAQVLAVITAAAKSGQLARTFEGVAVFFATLSQLLAPLTATFINLAEAAAPFVNLLAGKLADRVLKWFEQINANIASGGLARTFDTALAVLKDLFQLIGDLGSILGSVFGALSAGGESVIATIGGLTSQFAEFLKSTEGLKALSVLADVLHLIGSSLSLLLTPLLPVLAQLITALGGPLVNALKTLGPPLAKVIDAFAKVLTPLIEALAPVLDEIITLLADSLADILIQIADAVYELTPTLVELFKVLGPAAVTVVKGFGDVLIALLPIIPDLIEAMMNIVPVIVEFLPLIVAGSQAFAGLLLVVSKLAEGFAFLYGFAARYIAKGVAFILKDFITTLQDIPGAIVAAYDAVITFFTETIPGLFTSGKKHFKDFGDTVGQFPALITAALGTLADAITQPFTLGFSSAGASIGVGVQKVLNVFRNLPGQIGSFVGSIGSAAANIGRAIGNGLANIPGFAVEIGSKIVSRIKQFTNEVIGAINRAIGTLDAALPFSLPRIPFLARGAVITEPTTAVLGEAGKEVVIPLTDPARARQLAAESGLLDVLGRGFGDQPPPPVVYVYIGGEEITDRIDVRVSRAMNGQARELQFGNRGI